MKKVTSFIAIVAITLMPLGISFGLNYWEIATSATIYPNTLSSNWCQHSVIIEGEEYALNSTSYALIANAYSKNTTIDRSIRQKIVYTPTGVNGTVVCSGWITRILPEINIVTFFPKYRITYANLLPNKLPSDGCDYSVTFGDRNYALDTATHTMVGDEFDTVSNPNFNLRRRIKYRLTGRTGVVTCGWGSNIGLWEINIASIY